jgi:HK97 family phage major capsid protein
MSTKMLDPNQARTKARGLLSEARRMIDTQGERGGPAAEALMLQADGIVAGARFAWGPGDGKGGPRYDPLSWREVKVAGVNVRYHVPLAVEEKTYPSAFAAYLQRKGDVGSVGPADQKVLAEGLDTAGGFAVPEDWQARIVAKIAASVAAYRLATKLTTTRGQLTLPRVNYATDNTYTSAVRAVWTGEQPTSTAAQATDPVLGIVNVPVNTCMSWLTVTADLLEDSDVFPLATRLFGEAFSMAEASAYISGTGSGQPRGILTDVDGTDGVASVASGTSAAISTAADAHSGRRLLDLRANVPPQYWSEASWLMNATTEEAVDNLVDTAKRPLLLLEGANLPPGAVGTIKGRPVFVDQFMADVAANSYSVLFGDFSGYLIAERAGLTVEVVNDATTARQNLRILLARRRVGGTLSEPYRLRVLKAAA